MDFYSLGENSPVYVVRKKPFAYEVGSLKSKGSTPVQTNPYLPHNNAQTIDVVVSVNGKDEKIPGIPIGKDVVDYGNSYYAASTEGTLQAVSNLMQMAKNGIEEQTYYNSVISEGEKVVEQLNPQYAENKRQAKIVKDLQDHVDRQDKKLDTILEKLNELFSPSK